jgi:hypothetical protein
MKVLKPEKYKLVQSLFGDYLKGGSGLPSFHFFLSNNVMTTIPSKQIGLTGCHLQIEYLDEDLPDKEYVDPCQYALIGMNNLVSVERY